MHRNEAVFIFMTVKWKENAMKHCWTREEDIVACYLFKYSGDGIDCEPHEIANRLGVSPGSLQMRRSNFKALEGPRGLNNVSQLSHAVYSAYKDISKEAHLNEVQQILLAKSCPDAA
jgi:hypothetical protein